MQKDQDGYIVLFDAPKIEKPEFRLYYDEKGKVVCYTCEKLPGNYIVVDQLTFAQARPDVRVIDGVVSTAPACVVSKLMPSDTGTACTKYDVSIVVTDQCCDVNNWKMVTYEL